MAIRIIAGTAKGRTIDVPATVTRPTSSRAREAVFSSLHNVTGLRVLDMCAGSGALGIEALSRGAAHALFIDGNRKACETIEGNLAALGFDKISTVVLGNLPSVLRDGTIPQPLREFDVGFFDPPYAMTQQEVMQVLVTTSPLAADGARLWVERPSDAPPPAAGMWRPRRRLDHGAAALHLLTIDGASSDTPIMSDPLRIN